MNILPLVITLIVILSVITIEKMDRFKNKVIVQKQYEKLTENQADSTFNTRQRKLYGDYPIYYRQLTFRPFLQKKFRDEKPQQYKEIRQVAIDLIHVLYGHTKFFKKMEQKRPEFVSQLLDAVQASTEKMHANSIKRIHDISRIKLDDPLLQEAYYRMLKGTIDKDFSKKSGDINLMQNPKAYYPLITFLNNNDQEYKIKLGLAPRELLLAIYGNHDLVQKLIDLRVELTNNLINNKLVKDEATEKFKVEFEGKQKPGIAEILDYTITSTPKGERD